MIRIIPKLHDILNEFKEFEAGYTTKNKTEMIIQHAGKNYKVSFEELKETDIEQALNQL